MSGKLEKLKHDQYVAEMKLTAAKHKEKQLVYELKRLTRSERTHRLCTRAGMLEKFLRESTLLIDDDVSYNGIPTSKYTLPRALEKLAGLAGVHRIKIHALRHPYVKPTTKKFASFLKFFRAAAIAARSCSIRYSWLMLPFQISPFLKSPA